MWQVLSGMCLLLLTAFSQTQGGYLWVPWRNAIPELADRSLETWRWRIDGDAVNHGDIGQGHEAIIHAKCHGAQALFRSERPADSEWRLLRMSTVRCLPG